MADKITITEDNGLAMEIIAAGLQRKKNQTIVAEVVDIS